MRVLVEINREGGTGLKIGKGQKGREGSLLKGMGGEWRGGHGKKTESFQGETTTERGVKGGEGL